MAKNENVTLAMVYQKLEAIEEEVKEINDDLHTVKPEFIEKLKQSEKGKIHRFRNAQEMDQFIKENDD